MKKVICLSSFLLLLLLPMLLSAQLPRGVNRPAGVGTEWPVSPDDPSNVTFDFFVLLANLDLVNGVDCLPDQKLSLPSRYPDMYLECTVNGITETVRANVFERDGCTDDVYGINTSAYVFKHQLLINFANECQNGEINFPITISMRLLTESGNLYPVCTFAGLGDIFACNSYYFPEIPCNINGCNSSDFATFPEDTYYMICPGGGVRSDDINEENEQWKEQNLSIQVSPNPFSTNVNIRLNADMENATLRLFSVDGKLLQTKTNLSIKGDENLPLDTDNLMKGIYFLQIQNGSETVFTKLIKS